jgi:hypothetical protein
MERGSGYFIGSVSLRYEFEGRFAVCLWCDFEDMVPMDKYPTIPAGQWDPCKEPESLAQALMVRIDSRAFHAPPDEFQMQVLWRNLKGRLGSIYARAAGRLSVTGGLIGIAVGSALFLILCRTVLSIPISRVEIITALVVGTVLGSPPGLLFAAPARVLLLSLGYTNRKLHSILGRDINVSRIKAALDRTAQEIKSHKRQGPVPVEYGHMATLPYESAPSASNRSEESGVGGRSYYAGHSCCNTLDAHFQRGKGYGRVLPESWPE